MRTASKYGGTWLRDAVLSYAAGLYRQASTAGSPRRWFPPNICAGPARLGRDEHGDAQSRRRYGDVSSPGRRHDALREELDLPRDRKVLLYVGRLSPEKNIEMLLAAFEALHARNPNTYHLVIVGDGPLRRVLPATRHRTGALTWRSYLQDNAKLARYYRAADLFIHPGVCETFGLVVLEAQACGLPCVGIRGSFMDANVMAGLDLWAARNDSDDIADAIERFFARDLAALGAEVSQAVHARFSWNKVFTRQWALYTRARLQGAEVLRTPVEASSLMEGLAP